MTPISLHAETPEVRGSLAVCLHRVHTPQEMLPRQFLRGEAGIPTFPLLTGAGRAQRFHRETQALGQGCVEKPFGSGTRGVFAENIEIVIFIFLISSSW